MVRKVAGVKLETLEEPIRKALVMYQDISDDRLRFDVDTAAALELTPDKPNSARSMTQVLFDTGKGEVQLGQLAVVAFKPKRLSSRGKILSLDGTGDESRFQLEHTHVSPDLPQSTRILPRTKIDKTKKPKDRIHNEAHLTIVSQRLDQKDAEPVIFGGSMDLVGFGKGVVKKIGTLGHTPEQQGADIVPKATLTVGYHKNRLNQRSEEFGNPHAVYNPSSVKLQVCGFLAITEGQRIEYGDILANYLYAQEPIPLPHNAKTV